MDDTQPGSERSQDRERKLWTYVSLGLIIGGLFLLGRRNIKKAIEPADRDSISEPDTSLSDIKAQLDRIESTGESTKEQLGSQQRTARFYVQFNQGFALILALTGIGVFQIEQKDLAALLLWILFGSLLIITWAGLKFIRDYRRNIAVAGTITTLSGTSILTFLLLFNVTTVPIAVGIGWLFILSGLILMIIAVRTAGNH